MLRSANKLRGFKIVAQDEEMGKVRDLYFDDREWIVRYLVVDTGRWLSDRLVLISPASVDHVGRGDRQLFVWLSKAQVESSPPVETHEPLSRQREREIAAYYQWPTYWYGDATFPVPSYVPPITSGSPRSAAHRPSAVLDEEHEGDSHLRSVSIVTGYFLETLDDGLGHVDDFLIDDDTWDIRYLVVDTRNWWPGRKVLVSPRWVDEISWEQSRVRLSLVRENVKNAPEYNPQRDVERDYEERLHAHYGLPVYWKI